jgi:hypothetical protein
MKRAAVDKKPRRTPSPKRCGTFEIPGVAEALAGLEPVFPPTTIILPDGLRDPKLDAKVKRRGGLAT